MDVQLQQEQELAILASFKDAAALDGAADASCCNEDPDDGGYWGVRDGIEAGLDAAKSNKEVWAVQQYEPGETEASFDTGMFYFFIDTSFENVKKRIEELPSLLTDEEFAAVSPQILAAVPTATKIVNLRSESSCAVRLYVPHEGYDSNALPKKFNKIRLHYHIAMPKKKAKK